MTGDNGVSCQRPPATARLLCRAHAEIWKRSDQAGIGFEDFLARVQPLPSFGACVVASCFLDAAYKQTGLCDSHYQVWRLQGRPAGVRFQAWAARAPSRSPAGCSAWEACRNWSASNCSTG